MKVYQMNDCDWWIGPSLQDCKLDYIANTGDPSSVDDDAHELTDEELDRMKLNDIDEDERLTGKKWTFREQLAIELAKGGEFPRLFATNQY